MPSPKESGVTMLVRFKEHDHDAGAVTFVDELPPFGVVQIADSTFDDLGHPQELLVTLKGCPKLEMSWESTYGTQPPEVP